jgi:chromosome segregation ATPase
MEFSLIIMSFISLIIFHFSLQEMKYFPRLSFSTNQDIQIANYVRMLTILVSGVSLSYGMLVIGHKLELGGWENLTHPKNDLLLLILSFIGLGCFFGSRFLDKTIYKSMAKYIDNLDLEGKELIDKIKKEGIIIEIAKNKASAMEKLVDERSQLLIQGTQERLDLEETILEQNRKLALTDDKIKKDMVMKGHLESNIEKKEGKYKAHLALIDVLKKDLTTLGHEMSEVEKLLRKTDEKLQPLLQEANKKKGVLDLNQKEHQILIHSNEKTREEITSLTKKLKTLKQDSEKAREKESTLASDHEQMLQNLNQKESELVGLEKKISKYEKIVREFKVAEMSVESKQEHLELIQKRTEDHFNQESDGDGKIFTN